KRPVDGCSGRTALTRNRVFWHRTGDRLRPSEKLRWSESAPNCLDLVLLHLKRSSYRERADFDRLDQFRRDDGVHLHGVAERSNGAHAENFELRREPVSMKPLDCRFALEDARWELDPGVVGEILQAAGDVRGSQGPQVRSNDLLGAARFRL